jgi:hypothetical protein
MNAIRQAPRVARDAHILGPGESAPRAPAGFRTLQIGLTAHLRHEDRWEPALCGREPGSAPSGPPLGVCLTCRELAS